MIKGKPFINFLRKLRTLVPMEVEVKLRLKDSTAHQKLSNILSPYHKQTLFQENIFFDDKDSKLSSNAAVLRLRFYNLNSHCILSLKAKPTISDGISRVQELEEPVPLATATESVAKPQLLGQIDSKIMKMVKQEYGVGDEFVCLGGFKNVRAVYEWKGLKLELDETTYGFGTSYEIECESLEPERDRKLIEGLLEENGIEYDFSDFSKFAVFRSGKLPGWVKNL
ncbi:triphosphate tunnel metalloenzyme 3 [Citrus sinensis]|nr:triphosphate tunnel metalloenzyme 3-like [Citrus sinensis]XP_024036563.1 triphosphate tunel metalloenzyme 3 [Citrus x clementina]KAH9667127.1 triphosphate tunnel metalloenzyme 3 [Citrus sinensis]